MWLEICPGLADFTQLLVHSRTLQSVDPAMSLNPEPSGSDAGTRNASDENARFDWMLSAPMDLPPHEQWRYRSLAAMLHEEHQERAERPLLLGANRSGPLEVTLAHLRHAVHAAHAWSEQLGLVPGDSILLLRLPYSSEVPLAVAVLALMSLKFRVVLPMSFDQQSLAEIAVRTDSRAILWCANEAASTPQGAEADKMYRAVAQELGLKTYSLDGQLDWHLAPSGDVPQQSIPEELSDAEDEVLVLSTSGSTGRPKLVRYTDQALLRVAEAWNAAGLMSAELLGGRSICPTLSHSMGLRSVLHAIWNRQPILLAHPEWLEEHPKKFVKLLERSLPQHITCGPALLGDLSLLAASVRRVREALGSLRCIVSSGAAEAVSKHVFPGEVQSANAFGMTELQQVLNTLVGPPPAVRGALGHPLPGVSVGVRYLDAEQQLGRLFVDCPFGAKGYVGEPDFGTWFDSGDLVRVVRDELVWMGRADEDFLSTGHGVKVSLTELNVHYQRLQQEAEAVLFFSAPTRGGVAALVYLGDRDPGAVETHSSLLEAIQADHEAMAAKQQDFALAYQAITVVGCVSGRPPKRGPGKIDRRNAFAQQSELLTAMDDPLSEHHLVLTVPPYGSEKPDWRRFAAGNS